MTRKFSKHLATVATRKRRAAAWWARREADAATPAERTAVAWNRLRADIADLTDSDAAWARTTAELDKFRLQLRRGQ